MGIASGLEHGVTLSAGGGAHRVGGRVVRGGDATRFLATEETLSRRLGYTIEHPLRLFHLDALGVSFDALRRRVAPSFAELPWDEYDARRERIAFLKHRFPEHGRRLDDVLGMYFADAGALDGLRDLIASLGDDDRERFERIRPYRRRAMASFNVLRAGADPLAWEINREPDAPFAQQPDRERDYRSFERRFAPSPRQVTEAPEYLAMIATIAGMVDSVRGRSLRAMRIICHQMGLVARPELAVSNTPEGIHQDGSDYIVSALVVERHHIDGGESIVYGPDRRSEYLRHTLQEGEAIFQADAGSPLWHCATPVSPTDRGVGHDAVRNILGYDVHVV